MSDINYYLVPSPHPAGGRWVYSDLQPGPQIAAVHLGKTYRSMEWGTSFMVQGYEEPVQGVLEGGSPIFPKIDSFKRLKETLASVSSWPGGSHLEVTSTRDRRSISVVSFLNTLKNIEKASLNGDTRGREFEAMRDASIAGGAVELDNWSFQTEDGSIRTCMDDEGWIVAYGLWE